MTFSWSRLSNLFDYNINNESLPRKTDVIKNLGVLFDPKLTFKPYIRHIKNKALKLLGFIQRTYVDFKVKNTFILIYCSLVHSILNFTSIILPPYNIGLKIMLDKVQNTFLRFITYKCNIPRISHSSYTLFKWNCNPLP